MAFAAAGASDALPEDLKDQSLSNTDEEGSGPPAARASGRRYLLRVVLCTRELLPGALGSTPPLREYTVRTCPQGARLNFVHFRLKQDMSSVSANESVQGMRCTSYLLPAEGNVGKRAVITATSRSQLVAEGRRLVPWMPACRSWWCKWRPSCCPTRWQAWPLDVASGGHGALQV